MNNGTKQLIMSEITHLRFVFDNISHVICIVWYSSYMLTLLTSRKKGELLDWMIRYYK